MTGPIAKAARLVLALILIAGAQAQAGPRKREPRGAAPAPAVPTSDKRDSLVSLAGPFGGKPYWLGLAQCGGIYFKLNVLYTDVAVRARVVKPDPRANAEFTTKLKDAIKTATVFFDGAERFLMTERGLERDDAVLAYDGHARNAGERLKTIEAALAAAKACPALYQACRDGFPKYCGERLPPMG